MHFSCAIFALSFAALAHAQNYTILVGVNEAITYTPSYVNATTGDTLIFEFVSGNHTVTQSSFAAPCVSVAGVDSGFMPVDNSTPPMTFEYTLTNDSPMWFYCSQGTHCQHGMVFALNPTANETFAMFQQAAMGHGTTTTTTTASITTASITTASTTSTVATTPSAIPTTVNNSGVMLGGSITGVVGSIGLAWVLSRL